MKFHASEREVSSLLCSRHSPRLSVILSLHYFQICCFFVHFVLHSDSCLTYFAVEIHVTDPRIDDDSESKYQLCYWHEGTVGKGLTVDLTCAVNNTGRYVRIIRQTLFGDNHLTLCEVEVRGVPLQSTCRGK